MSRRIREEYNNILVLYIKNELVGYWKLQKNKKKKEAGRRQNLKEV